MKTIIKMFPYVFCLVSYLSYGQSLTLVSGGSLTVASGTDFYVDGINLNPTAPLTLNGPIDFSRTATPVGESIDRVFNFSNPITNFQGEVTFFYEESDLSATGVLEPDLVLRVKDGTTWGADLIPTIIREDLNFLTYTFPPSTSFSSITASKPGVTLSINKFNELKINLFPNPVISSFQITTDLSIETLIYSNLGQVVFKSKQKNIDVSQLSAGTYLIVVKDINSGNFNSYQIIKL